MCRYCPVFRRTGPSSTSRLGCRRGGSRACSRCSSAPRTREYSECLLVRCEHSLALHTPPLAVVYNVHLHEVGARSCVGLMLARYKSNSKWVYLRLNWLNLQHLLHKIRWTFKLLWNGTLDWCEMFQLSENSNYRLGSLQLLVSGYFGLDSHILMNLSNKMRCAVVLKLRNFKYSLEKQWW